MAQSPIVKCVEDFGEAVVRNARANLQRENANASKTLSRSISYTYKRGKIHFLMEKYGAWLDQGVSGTGRLTYRNGNYMPVAYNKSDARPEYSFKSQFKMIGGSLKAWLRYKGLDESLDFVMRRSVHARGIRPRRFFTYAFDKQLPKFDECLGKAATKMVNDHLDNILKN